MSKIYQGVNYADTQSVPFEFIDQGQQDCPSYRSVDTFVLTADLASGDTILMGGPIPEGAILIECRITSEALGGSCTINAGWQAGPTGLEVANAVGFFSALPVSSATVASAHGSTYEGMTSNLSNFYLHKLQEYVQPVIAENAVSSGATGLQISMEIIYNSSR